VLSRDCGQVEPSRRIRPPGLLSNLRDLQGERGRSRDGRWSGERLIQPGPEVPVSKELELEQRHEIGQGPTEGGPELEVHEHQQGGPETVIQGSAAGKGGHRGLRSSRVTRRVSNGETQRGGTDSEEDGGRAG